MEPTCFLVSQKHVYKYITAIKTGSNNLASAGGMITHAIYQNKTAILSHQWLLQMQMTVGIGKWNLRRKHCFSQPQTLPLEVKHQTLNSVFRSLNFSHHIYLCYLLDLLIFPVREESYNKVAKPAILKYESIHNNQSNTTQCLFIPCIRDKVLTLIPYLKVKQHVSSK